MHSRAGLGADLEGGPALLQQLGRLIVRPRSTSPAANAHRPSTSQVQIQPKSESDEVNPHVEAQLSDRIHALWEQQIPLCIEVLLAPDCLECRSRPRDDRRPARLMLLERWTMRALPHNGVQSPAFINPQWLLNAVRSQLHFSQLSAWLATLEGDDTLTERRRKLSREMCNYKKLESNCDQSELSNDERKLNVVYSVTAAGDTRAEFARTPTAHTFPITDIGSSTLLKVVVEALPRTDVVPSGCGCKRRASKDHDDLAGKLNDLTLGTKFDPSHMPPSVVDDRMLTPCSESGKHRCSCDDESDSQKTNQPKKLDERRLKEIAKYKRRLRKESKMKKLCDSTSSEGDHLKAKETRTSIPILQAARFDRFRAIGCYRNQTYLTLPASRIETKSPFIDTDAVPPTEFKRTNTVSTQTDDLTCPCGNQIEIKCGGCTANRMVRSDGNYDLSAIENGARRKCEEEEKSIKKLKCDNSASLDNDVVKRPKLRRIFPVVDKIGQIVTDREVAESHIKELHLKSDDSVFSVPKESKRQKKYSIGDDDYVLYEKCDYGTFEKCNVESPTENGCFKFPKVGDNQVPSPTEMDRFRWRFDSAASMVFHSKTGLPLTSSPAPLRRGNNCFDFDDSINGVSGIKSALFHPIRPAEGSSPAASPASPAPPAPPTPRAPRPRMGPSAGLLGSFEESALKGRLEPVATVHGFTAELGASGAFCPPHKRLPVTVFFYAPGGTNAPYMGHIELGGAGYHVARSGTIQVSLFNPHGTLVKMFVVLYSLGGMPPLARTFLRQRTLYLPAGAPAPPAASRHKWLRYLIHLRFMTSKSGKLYLHTDIRIIVSRKADLDTATAHSAIYRPIPTTKTTNDTEAENKSTNQRSPNRVFGGCGDYDGEKSAEICYENQNGVSYELRSFTYAPENPKYSPR